MNVKAGDEVTRYMSSERIPMKLKVTAVTDERVICGAWTFDRKTGAEIDEVLGWGPDTGVTGSVIEVTP